MNQLAPVLPSIRSHDLIKITALALAMLTCQDLRADVDVGLAGQVSTSPAGPRYSLSWDGVAAAAYGVQVATNLPGSSAWTTVDVARPTNSAPGGARWMSPEALSARTFFRLSTPQPEIFSVEPAVFAPGEEPNLYVLGQFFEATDEISMDGVMLGGENFIDHTTLRIPMPGQPAGLHTVAVVRAGQALSSFVVICADVATSPELVLQEPPVLPPAAPVSMKVKEKGGRTKCASSLRVTASGQMEMYFEDLVVPGRGLDFVWARTYLSRTGPTNSLQGTRWSHSYDVWCVTNGSEVVVFDGAGRKDTFRLQANGTYTAPGMFREGVMTNTGFRLTFADSGYWEFSPPPGGSSAGKMVVVRLVDRAGNVSTCDYDGSGRLLHVVDDLGRTNTLAYDVDGRLESVTDFSGRSVTYAYYQGLPGEDGAAGDLSTVTSPPVTGTPNTNDFPSGKKITYTYSHDFVDERENHLLLSVGDPLGQTTAEFIYQHNTSSADFLSCISVQRGADVKMITREVVAAGPSNRFAVARVFLNDYVGNVTECFYDARQRCVLMREFTGRATPGVPVTAISNRPAIKLRDTDPDYYDTTWSWNSDSLCTRLVMPRGNAIECVYEADMNKATAPRKRCDLRVVREIAGTGEPDIVTTVQHDPRFGSDPTASRMRTRINELECILKNIGILARAIGDTTGTFNPIKWQVLGKVRGMMAQSRSDTMLSASSLELQRLGGDVLFHGSSDMSSSDFTTSSTDPNGNQTVCEYDAEGNRIKVRFPWLDGGDTDFAYDAFGGLVAITNAADGNGRRRVDSFVRSNGFVVVQDVDSGAGGLHLVTVTPRDAYGNATRCTDPRGNDTLFTYNALNQCVRSETPTNLSARCTTDYFYDANDNLVSVVEDVRSEEDVLLGTKALQYTYDLRNRLTLVQDQVDEVESALTGYAYDGNDNVVILMGGEGVTGLDPANRIDCEYDERNLLFREIRAPGSPLVATNTTSYTLNGRVATKQVVDASDVSTVTYDGFDRPIAALDAMGNVATSVYDACGNLVRSRIDGETNDVTGSTGNRRLAECFYDYDGHGRCTRTREAHFDIGSQAPVGDGYRTTTMAYAPNGDLSSITDDLGRATRNAYDNAGRCASVTDALSNRVEFAHDGRGNVVSETRRERSDLGGPEQVFTLTNTYDALCRRVRSVDNAGNTNRWLFNSLGQCVKHVDSRGVTTFREYDLVGRPTQTIGDLNGDELPSLAEDFSERATWSSSNPNRLLSTLDSHSNVTTYTYDSLDRVTNVVHADGTQRKLVWSPKSNIASEEDANGTVVAMTYDLNDRCMEKLITPGSGVATNTTFEHFEYDGLSRLVGHHDDDCDGRDDYDSLGNCIRETINGLSTVATYDSLSRRASLTYPGGRSFTIARDLLGRCSSISEGGFALAVNEYDGPARLARVTYANNLRTTISYDGIAGATNEAGDFGWRQVSRVLHAAVGGSPVLNDCTFAWDRDGNKTARVEILLPPAIPRTNSLALRYDLQSRLTNALLASGSTLLRDTDYAFDLVGNRTNVTGAACAGRYEMDASALGPRDFQMNQYTVTPCDSRTYDENGNLIGSAGPVTSDSYAFDYASRLVSITRNGQLLVALAYDPLGRRLSMTAYPTSLPPVTTRYVYDGNDLIEERTGTTVIASYVHRVGSSVVLDGSRSTDDGEIKTYSWTQVSGPFAMRRGGADYFLHADDQGSVVAITDTNGLAVERYRYDDYGAVTFLTSDGTSNGVSSSVVGNPFLHHGMQFESASGLYFVDDRDFIGLREYNPAMDYLAGDCVVYGRGHEERILNDYLIGDSVCPNGTAYDPGTGRTLTRSGGTPDNNPWSGGSSAKQTRNDLKDKFQNGDIPDQSDFADTIDSALNLADDGLTSYSALLPRTILKSFFEKGDKPTQAQFSTLLDSMVNFVDDREFIGLQCAKIPRTILKEYFEKGDKPTQGQFSALLDSMVKFNSSSAAGRKHELTGNVTLIK